MKAAVQIGTAALLALSGLIFLTHSLDLRAEPQNPVPTQAPRPAFSQPPRDQPTPQTGTSVIRGRITETETGRPLRRASVTLTSPALGRENRTANTDTQGRYQVKDLPAGRYTLTVRRSGSPGYGTAKVAHTS